MRTVYKYRPDIRLSPSVLSVPVGWRPVLVGADPLDGGLAVWFEVDTAVRPVPVPVYVYGTGHPVPPGRRHLGSAVCGPFVWHVYTDA